jgi:hypothetical protein
MKSVPTGALFACDEILIPAFSQKTPAAVVYSNAAQIGLKHFAARMLQHVYQPHTGVFDAVTLGVFPPGTRMLGGHNYLIEANGRLAAEQISPAIADVQAVYDHLSNLNFATETIDDDCLLVARYGDVTWGHWVAEILPRAILAEHAYPGRFRFMIADQIIGETDYGMRILESLAAYGIAPERLLALRIDRHYQFSRLHAITNIWSFGGMNPQVMQIMRDNIANLPPSHSTGRLAVLRRDAKTRNFANIDEVIALMIKHGFTVVDMSDQPFLNQLAFFRDCHTIFAVQGSGLAGLIYSPEGVNVATAAPSAWDDTYFHGIIQHRHGSHADIRCPVIWDGQGLERDAPMVAIPAHVEAGLAALAMPETERAPDGVLTVGGQRLRRHAGETILRLDFNEGGMAHLFLGEGWGDQEPNHIWSIGPRSSISIPRPFETDKIELQLDVIALVNPDYLIARKLDVTVNGIAVGSFAVANHARLSCALPASCFNDGLMLNIIFDHPFCVSAAATGHAPDDRPLGLGFVSLHIVSFASVLSSSASQEVPSPPETALV